MKIAKGGDVAPKMSLQSNESSANRTSDVEKFIQHDNDSDEDDADGAYPPVVGSIGYDETESSEIYDY